jgi:hypothetical protein
VVDRADAGHNRPWRWTTTRSTKRRSRSTAMPFSTSCTWSSGRRMTRSQPRSKRRCAALARIPCVRARVHACACISDIPATINHIQLVVDTMQLRAATLSLAVPVPFYARSPYAAAVAFADFAPALTFGLFRTPVTRCYTRHPRSPPLLSVPPPHHPRTPPLLSPSPLAR